jgi:DNA-binding CsgD family transcriptional regulator
VDPKNSARGQPADYAIETIAEAASIGAEALNALSTGVAILDPRGHVLLANAVAKRLFKQATVFRCSPPLALALCHAESSEALRKALANAWGSASAALQLRDAEARAVINAVVLPLPAASEWSGGWTRRVVLLAMNELTCAHAIPDRWLSQMFGLTRAEASITNWVVSGRTIDAYARHRGVSLETARSQLKTVLSKTGMSRQVQLVAALSRLPIEYMPS